MKISAALFLTSITSASAFVTPVADQKSSMLRMSDPRKEDTWGGVGMDVKNVSPPQTREPAKPIMSKAIPFVEAPAALDGSMAGDVGFDPLGFAKSKADLNYYREAEIKHARLAMLAAAGWPVSELFDKKIANLVGMTPVLDETNRAPSVLNGGLGKVSPVYWGVCLLLAGAIDVYSLSRASKTEGYIAGDLGFDPFGMYPKDEAGKMAMRTKEIKNGRLAMLAITAFAAQEFISHVAVIDQTPIFFKPFWEVMFQQAGDISTSAPAVFEAVSKPEVFESISKPEVFEPAIFEPVTTSIDSAVTSTVESATSAAVSPVDTVSAASAESTTVAPTVSSSAVNEELAAANKRITELEAKLASISDLTR